MIRERIEMVGEIIAFGVVFSSLIGIAIVISVFFQWS